MNDKVKEFEVKNIEQDPDKDVELPEIPAWDRIFGRPTSLGDLDPDAEARLDDVDATFLTLGDIAFLDSITETEITNGAITTPKLATGSVVASKIQSGSITTNKLDSEAVTANKINVGDLFGENISATGSITGALIRTSSGGDRVEIDDVDDSIKIYESNDLRIEIYEDRITFYEDDGTSDVVSLYASPSGNFLLAGTSGNDIFISSDRDLFLNAEDDLFIFSDDEITINTGSLADDVYIGLGSNTFMQFGDGRIYLDTYFDMQGNSINDAGNITCVNLTETSDIRRKKNVKPLAYGLQEILKLQPIQYQFKQHNQKQSNRRAKNPLQKDKVIEKKKSQQKHLGFSAQDVYKILPEVTEYADKDGEETARLYSTQIIPVLVRAIQELHNEVELLKG